MNLCMLPAVSLVSLQSSEQWTGTNAYITLYLLRIVQSALPFFPGSARCNLWIVIYWFTDSWVMGFRLQSINNSIPKQQCQAISRYPLCSDRVHLFWLYFISGHWQGSYLIGGWGCCACTHASKASDNLGVYRNFHKGDAIEESEQW